MVSGACGGTGYRPSRCSKSMRFRPNAWILTMAWPAAALGLAIWSTKREVAGPLPPLTAVLSCKHQGYLELHRLCISR